MSTIGVAVTDQESLTDMVWANAERFGDAVGFRRRDPDAWLDVDPAFARGVTGIPTVAIGNELFWGDDHLEQAAAAASR